MRPVAVVLLAGLLAATASAARPRATVASFSGDWRGHTRSLLVTQGGLGSEHVDDGCCTPVIDLHFQILRVRGTVDDATATFRVRAVTLYHQKIYWKTAPRPHVGQLGQLRLKKGVVVETLSGANYCNDRTPKATQRVCGA